MGFGGGVGTVVGTCGGPCGFECVRLMFGCDGDGGAGAFVGFGIGVGGPWVGTGDSLAAVRSVLVSGGDDA